MTVFKVRNSPYWQYEFQREGCRHYGSTKCLKLADAEAFENTLIERVESKNKSLQLASTLPRYVVREPFGEGWRYYFIVPAKARQAGCPMRNEGLGTAFEVAVARAEDVLLPAFDAWCQEQKIAELGADSSREKTTTPPSAGVYLLLHKGKVVYVGSSKQMEKRVTAHRSASRPFDEVFYIGTHESERTRLEAILIRAIGPSQNTNFLRRSVPDSVPSTPLDPLPSC